MINKILVQSSGVHARRFYRETRRIASGFLKFIKRRGYYIEIHFVNDRIIKNINRVYRGVNAPTNVLVLSWFGVDVLNQWPRNKRLPWDRFIPIGEVYLATSFFNKKEKMYDWRRLLIHGLLHIFGYDHIRKNDRIKMDFLEYQLCQKFFLQV